MTTIQCQDGSERNKENALVQKDSTVKKKAIRDPFYEDPFRPKTNQTTSHSQILDKYPSKNRNTFI
jgi:hypothetical protein